MCREIWRNFWSRGGRESYLYHCWSSFLSTHFYQKQEFIFDGIMQHVWCHSGRRRYLQPYDMPSLPSTTNPPFYISLMPLVVHTPTDVCHLMFLIYCLSIISQTSCWRRFDAIMVFQRFVQWEFIVHSHDTDANAFEKSFDSSCGRWFL